jgi:hypothetical protein
MDEATVTCPWCWEEISLAVDLSEERQDYVEDCPVCCHPMRVTVIAEDGELVSCEVDR